MHLDQSELPLHFHNGDDMVGATDAKTLISQWNDPTARIPRIKLDLATMVAQPAPDPTPEDEAAAQAFRAAYLAAIEESVTGVAKAIHMAVSDDLMTGEGQFGHSAFLVADHVPLADTIARLSYTQPQFLDHVVVVGSRLVERTDPTEVRLIVACDLGAIVEHVYPIEAEGPVAPLLPSLVQMAGSLVLSYDRLGLDNAAVADAAMLRLYEDLSHRLYGEGIDGATRVAEDYPAVVHMADAVVDAALEAARGVEFPTDATTLVDAVHEAVAKAVASLGCKVLS